MMMSLAAPSQIPSTGFGPTRYLQASIISQAKRAATPASRVLPRYGSQTFSDGRVELGLGPGDPFDGPVDGLGGDIFRH